MTGVYPVKFLEGDEAQKHWTVPADIAPEALMTGRYQFGSNELSIFRTLAKIVEMIERDYGVRLADTELQTQQRSAPLLRCSCGASGSRLSPLAPAQPSAKQGLGPCG